MTLMTESDGISNPKALVLLLYDLNVDVCLIIKNKTL